MYNKQVEIEVIQSTYLKSRKLYVDDYFILGTKNKNSRFGFVNVNNAQNLLEYFDDEFKTTKYYKLNGVYENLGRLHQTMFENVKKFHEDLILKHNWEFDIDETVILKKAED